MSDEKNPRQFAADDLNGSLEPTGAVSHTESTTHEADDTTNEPTGAVEPGFSEAPQSDDGTVTIAKPEEVSTKVVSAPETPEQSAGPQAETA